MRIESRSLSDVTILDLAGRFEAATVPQVEPWIREATAAPPAKVLVNLSGVSFMDSSALALLVQGMKRSRQQGGDLRLYGLQQTVRIIFELTRLDKAFEIYASEADGLALFSS